MTAEGWVLIITAAGAQLTMVLKQMQMSRAVGKSNGTGSVHETLTCMNKKLDALGARLEAVESKVH